MSILNQLDRWASTRDDAYIFLDSQGGRDASISFQQLRERALQIAAGLNERNLGKERVILALPPGVDFIVSFVGCLYAGAIAVPLPPPRSKRQLVRSDPVIQDAAPALIVTDLELDSDFPLPSLTVEQLQAGGAVGQSLPKIKTNDIAFLQYTSGSTSLPKGVILTHSHLFQHQKVLKEAFQHNEETKIVGWLPFYHDMGLIGNILHTLYLGVSTILMTPMTFIQHPAIWLQAISRYRATTSGGPNFAYRHCVSKISDPELEGLDLSSWKRAFNGSENVEPDTLKAFSDRFSQVGFSPSSFYPCYGLAEATLFVTGREGAISIPYKTPEGQIVQVVSCGAPMPGESVLIVDPASKRPCLEGVRGEIWIQGPSVAAGYWNKQEETFGAYTADGVGPFLRSGDMGFIKEGELFLLGRLKNLIIIRGKNYFPNDLEGCVRKAHPLLTHTQGVAFSLANERGESLIILQEVDRSLKSFETAQKLFKAIKASLFEEFDLSPAAIVFVKPNSLPRTTSGKLQHYVAREEFQRENLSPLFSWRQETTHFIEEETVVQALAKILGISAEQIAPDDPLIALGIDSLIGTRFLSWIQDQFGVEIELNFLLNGATVRQIEELTDIYTNKMKNQLETTFQTEYPLSWNQESIWVFNQLNPKSLAYNILFAIRAKGGLDAARFREALSQVVARHAALRTRFAPAASGPVQIVSESIDLPLFIHDFKDRQEEIAGAIEEERKRVFDLTQAPLFRVVWLEISKEETVLILHFHHMICDGRSIGIFIEELEALYQKSAQISPPSCQYNDFVNWQKAFALGDDYKRVENQWKQLLLSDEYPVLSLSPFLSTEDGSGSKRARLGSETVGQLKAFASEQKCSLAVVLMAVFQGILHLYSGESKVYTGFPAANCPKGDLQRTIGFFVNTLVCKTEAKSETTFLNLIEQVKKGIWQGTKEAAYPFSHLLNLLRPPRSPNTSPLFQAMFVMQNAPVGLKQFAGVEIELLETLPADSLYDLVLEVQEKNGGIELLFEYQKGKISSSFAEEIEQSYLKLLHLAIRSPQDPLEKHNLASKGIVQLFERQVDKNPQKIAVYSDYGPLTYRELCHAAISIANQLLKEGIKPGEPVGICLEKEPLLIASLLGILKAGGAYVPIDSAYPVDRIQTILEDAQVRFLIARKKFSNFEGKILDPALEDKDMLDYPPPTPELPAYILFTSGSTGRPKGVVVEHKSLENFVLAAIDIFEMKPADRSLQFSSISWDTSSEEIYPCLLTGGSLVLRKDGPVESFDGLLERTKKHEITLWNLPSSYWHDLVDMMDRKKIPIPDSLRLIIVGGEKVNRSRADLWSHKVKLLNTYGATEATSISAVFDLANWKPEWVDVPIGSPIQNVELYILNSEMQNVPAGMPGTLYIGGAGVARGYLNNPELTARKFVLHPKSRKRIYNTGDSAYYSLTGEILLKGRKDRQIKRRGFRIELEEVEKALFKLDGVETSLVTFDGVMTAYVVARNQSPQGIKNSLRQLLPDYLIPDQILFVPALPRLPNGKIDFVSLKSIQAPKMVIEEPLTDTEQRVLAIWRSILGVDSIVKEESFFDVGGNSLLLIRLHEKLQEAFSIKINISILFSHFTIVSQAREIERESIPNATQKLANGQVQSAENRLEQRGAVLPDLRQLSIPPSDQFLSRVRYSPQLTKIEILKKLEKGLMTPNEAHELLKR